MSPKMVKITAIIIAFIFGFAIIFPLFSMFVQADTTQEKITKQQQEQKKLQQQINDVKNKKKDVMAEKQAIDKEIDSVQVKIDELTVKINNTDVSIKAKEAELSELTAKVDRQYDTYKERIRVMYEQGPTSYLDILLSSENVADFLNRYEIIKQIAEYDKTMLEKLKSAHKAVEDTKIALENEKSAKEQNKAEFTAQKSTLDKKMASRDKLMNELNQSQAEAEKAYEESERMEKQLKASLAAIASTSTKGEKYVGGEFQWPVPGYYTLTDTFGMRRHPVLKVNKMHTGVDIAVPSGVGVLALNSGKVIKAGYNGAYGNHVAIDHGGGVVTLYAHASKLLVTVGQQVTKGQKIMLVGSTGYSTGPHLHLEVIKNGVATNPMSNF